MVVGFWFGFFSKNPFGCRRNGFRSLVFGLRTRATCGGNGFVAQVSYGDLWDNATVNLLTDNR